MSVDAQANDSLPRYLIGSWLIAVGSLWIVVLLFGLDAATWYDVTRGPLGSIAGWYFGALLLLSPLFVLVAAGVSVWALGKLGGTAVPAAPRVGAARAGTTLDRRQAAAVVVAGAVSSFELIFMLAVLFLSVLGACETNGHYNGCHKGPQDALWALLIFASLAPAVLNGWAAVRFHRRPVGSWPELAAFCAAGVALIALATTLAVTTLGG